MTLQELINLYIALNTTPPTFIPEKDVKELLQKLKATFECALKDLQLREPDSEEE